MHADAHSSSGNTLPFYLQRRRSYKRLCSKSCAAPHPDALPFRARKATAFYRIALRQRSRTASSHVIALLNLGLFGSRRLCRAPGLIMRAETIIRYKTKVDSRAFSYARILANCTHIARIAFVLPLLGTCLHTVRPGPYTAHGEKQK